MKILLCLIGFLLTSRCGAAVMHLGTNPVPANRVVEFSVPLNARGIAEGARARLRMAAARGGIIIPERFNLTAPHPILVVSVPSGGSSIRAIGGYTNVALGAGWIVLAGEGPRVDVEQDTVQWGWGMLSSVLDYVSSAWPQAKGWPIACAGFSGGAKRSGAIAAALMKEGYSVIGIFMGGCNEDRVTLGLELFRPGEQFQRIPIFLSNGTADPIAGPQHVSAAADSMRRNGFKNLRLETYNGGHRLDNEQLRRALQWFRDGVSIR